jgi:hypothetical protein
MQVPVVLQGGDWHDLGHRVLEEAGQGEGCQAALACGCCVCVWLVAVEGRVGGTEAPPA